MSAGVARARHSPKYGPPRTESIRRPGQISFHARQGLQLRIDEQQLNTGWQQFTNTWRQRLYSQGTGAERERMSATGPAPEAEVNWDAFMGRTRSLLQSRSPKVRTQNLTIDVPVMAADPDVTSEQRAELVHALINAYPLYRDRPSRLLLQSAVDTILRLEAQKSSSALVNTGLFKQAVESLGEKVDEFGEVLSKQRGERRKCSRLYELVCVVLRRVMQADTEAALRESKNWKPLMLVHVRLCDLIFGAEIQGKSNRTKIRFPWDHLQLHAACTAVMAICSTYEKTPLLFETLGELASTLPTPTPALAALEWPIDACLYLRVGKEQERAAPGNVGRKYLREYKEYLLKLFVTHIVGSKAIPPARSLRVFYGLLHTEVSVTDVEQSVFPEMENMYTKSTKQVLRVAAFLAGDASWSSMKGWYSRARMPRRTCGLWLRRDTTELGNLKSAIASRFSKTIYPSVTSTDLGTRDAAFSLFKALQLSEEEKYEVLCSVLRDVHLEGLAQPEQRQGLYALLNLLTTSVEAIDALGQFVLMECHPEPLRVAVGSLLCMFKKLSQEADLPKNVAPALLTKLRSSDVSVRLMVLSKMTDDSCSWSCGSVVPRDKSDRPRTALFEQLVPAIEACLELGSRNAHVSSDAALEACTAMRMLLRVPEKNCSTSILRALRSNPILQCPLKARPQPSFLLDHRTAKRMYGVVPQRGFTIEPTALCNTLYDVVSRYGGHALDDPDIKDLVFQQIREQMRAEFSISRGSVEQFAGLLSRDKPMLAVELINYLAWSFKGSDEFSTFNLSDFSWVGAEDHCGYEDWLPQMIVSAHISGKSRAGNTTFEAICEAENIGSPAEQVSKRVDEYLAEIDAAARDPVRAEAAAAAYNTVLHLAPEAVLSRAKRRL